MIEGIIVNYDIRGNISGLRNMYSKIVDSWTLDSIARFLAMAENFSLIEG
jgi:hypothetical protein